MALVIGNSAYQTVPALPNPANDAKAVAEYLKSAGFEVTALKDLSQADMRQAVGQFADALAGKGRDTVALLYYAGHGLQVDGENYLVPVDAGIVRESDVPLQALRLADVMNTLAAVPTKSRIVMLDACRNNPFSQINKVTGKGLAIVDAPADTIVSYSTSPGSEAQDGDGEHSPYTTAFLSLTKDPGLPIEQAFKRMRFSVNDTTSRQQLPWESSSLTSDFSFFPRGSEYALQSAPAGTLPATKVAVGGPTSIDIGNTRKSSRSVDAWKRELQRRSPVEAYELVIRDDTVEAYQAYLALFPNQSLAPSVQTVVERRNVMLAWYVAVTVNTPASIEAFLAAYPDTDLTLTAKRLLERAQSRANLLPATANVCPCAIQQQPQQQQEPQKPHEQRATRSLEKKAAKKEPKKEKRAKKEKREKVARRGKHNAEPQEEEAPSQPAQQSAPSIPMMPIGIGMGFPGGGFMGGGGRGMGHRGGGGTYGSRGTGAPAGTARPSTPSAPASTPASTGSGGPYTSYPR